MRQEDGVRESNLCVMNWLISIGYEYAPNASMRMRDEYQVCVKKSVVRDRVVCDTGGGGGEGGQGQKGETRNKNPDTHVGKSGNFALEKRWIRATKLTDLTKE